MPSSGVWFRSVMVSFVACVVLLAMGGVLASLGADDSGPSHNGPFLQVVDVYPTDPVWAYPSPPGADGDGVIEAGELGRVDVALRNVGNGTARFTYATINMSDPLIRLLDPRASWWGDIPNGTTKWTGSDHFLIRVSPKYNQTSALLNITIHCKDDFNDWVTFTGCLTVLINRGFFEIDTDREPYLVGDTVMITATLTSKTNRSIPFLEGSVTVNITRPDLAVDRSLMLYDDGTHGDPVPSDGRYTNTYPLGDDCQTGYYRIDATARLGDRFPKTFSEFRVFGYGPPRIDWDKSYGGDKEDQGLGIVRSGDGGFVIAGYTRSFGVEYEDIYILKVDANGNKVWEKTYGWSKDDGARDIVRCSDGGFILVGYANKPYRIHDYTPPNVYILRIDGEGNKVWEKMHEANWGTFVYCIAQSLDGGYIVGGVKDVPDGGMNMNLYIFKIDANGDTVWERTYGGRDDERAYDIIQSGDGGYVVAGFTNSFGAGEADVYILKIDQEGEKIWERTYGGNGTDISLSIIRSLDGGYIVVGKTMSFKASPDYDMYLLKIDEYGEKVWEKTYGGMEDDQAFDMVDSGDGFIVTGFTETWGPLSRWVYLLKIDREGGMVWEWKWGKNGEFAEGGTIVKSGDGGFVVAGCNGYLPRARSEDIYLLKIRDEPWSPIPESPFAVLVLGVIACLNLCITTSPAK